MKPGLAIQYLEKTAVPQWAVNHPVLAPIGVGGGIGTAIGAGGSLIKNLKARKRLRGESRPTKQQVAGRAISSGITGGTLGATMGGLLGMTPLLEKKHLQQAASKWADNLSSVANRARARGEPFVGVNKEHLMKTIRNANGRQREGIRKSINKFTGDFNDALRSAQRGKR